MKIWFSFFFSRNLPIFFYYDNVFFLIQKCYSFLKILHIEFLSKFLNAFGAIHKLRHTIFMIFDLPPVLVIDGYISKISPWTQCHTLLTLSPLKAWRNLWMIPFYQNFFLFQIFRNRVSRYPLLPLLCIIFLLFCRS